MPGKNLTRKILEKYLVQGTLEHGKEIAVMPNKGLLQDATGPMAWLQFEEFGKDSIRKGLTVVQYIDHRHVQPDERDPQDQRFLREASVKYGAYFSPLGNGICHQVHFERFAEPGDFTFGADSHTTTHGAMSGLAMGVGGLEAAVAMAGFPLVFEMPAVVEVQLRGKLPEWVSGKDVILEILRRLGVKGGVGKIFEFTGSGLRGLSVTQRAVIANMIMETGATAGIFPADDRTKSFLQTQRRSGSFKPLSADPHAIYDDGMEIDLSKLEPLVALPQSPGNVVSVREVEGIKVSQVAVGSSVNSWPEDMALVAEVLRGKKLPVGLEVAMSPGSKQIQLWMMRRGYWEDLLRSGVRSFEAVCGPCIGMGFAPCANEPSLRTMNRNFPGRSGTYDDKVYLSSPAVAAATAIFGKITDPRKLGKMPRFSRYSLRKEDFTDDRILKPILVEERLSIPRPSIPSNMERPHRRGPLPEKVQGALLARFGDNISTDSISPAGIEGLPDRSNIPRISRLTFIKEMSSDHSGVSRFYDLACDAKKLYGGGFIIAGENYGQGSSREHAALAPSWLGVHAVFAKSFARIHRSNLIGQGLLPLVITHEILEAVRPHPTQPFPRVLECDVWELPHIRHELMTTSPTVMLKIGDKEFKIHHGFTEREREILLLGGLISYLTK